MESGVTVMFGQHHTSFSRFSAERVTIHGASKSDTSTLADWMEPDMSGQRKRRPRRFGSGPVQAKDPGHARAEELTAAGRRAAVAKGLFGAAAAITFGAAALFARHSYPGHPKSPAVPLGAPPKFVDVVRQNLLQAGVVAPAQAPPDASTSVS